MKMNHTSTNNPTPKEGELIEITERRCGGKVQPTVKAGDSYLVKSTDRLKDGTPVLVVYNRSDAKREQRINAARFGWTVLTEEMLEERAFKEKIRKTTLDIQDKFSQAEHLYMVLVPQVYAQLAFRYARRCRKYAAANRIAMLTKLGKAYDTLERDYEEDVGKDLDYNHRQNVRRETVRFFETYQRDFMILYLSVNQEFKKKMPDWPYSDMRSEAICGMLMIDLYREHNKTVDSLIASRLGRGMNSVANPKIEALYSILDAYAGEVGRYDFNERNVQTAKAVIRNRVKQIDFDITNI